ncbi:hypothetical protein D3C87_1520640 [compost metagenome]
MDGTQSRGLSRRAWKALLSTRASGGRLAPDTRNRTDPIDAPCAPCARSWLRLSSGERRAITHGRLPVSPRRKEVFHGSPRCRRAYLGISRLSCLCGVRNRANRHRDGRDAGADQPAQKGRRDHPEGCHWRHEGRNRHQELDVRAHWRQRHGVARPSRKRDVPAVHRTQDSIPARHQQGVPVGVEVAAGRAQADTQENPRRGHRNHDRYRAEADHGIAGI